MECGVDFKKSELKCEGSAAPGQSTTHRNRVTLLCLLCLTNVKYSYEKFPHSLILIQTGNRKMLSHLFFH